MAVPDGRTVEIVVEAVPGPGTNLVLRNAACTMKYGVAPSDVGITVDRVVGTVLVPGMILVEKSLDEKGTATTM